jgi:REP element-mobilizing transposase RayT
MSKVGQEELFGPRGGVRVRNGHTRTRKVTKRRRAKNVDGTPKRRGRPPKGKRAGAPHKARPELKPRHPVHIVLRVVREIGSLRKRFMYAALREATIAVALRELHDK